MSRQWYSKRHYERLSNGGLDSEKQVAERTRWREAGQQAYAEATTMFGEVTQHNALDFDRWQQERARELYAKWKEGGAL